MTPLKVGDRVLTLPTVRPRKWADRSGTIAVLNRRDREVGVSFAAVPRNEAEAWFLRTELTLVKGGHGLQDRPGGSRRPERSVGAGETS
jgi:hypothetical protein